MSLIIGCDLYIGTTYILASMVHVDSTDCDLQHRSIAVFVSSTIIL